MIYTPMTKKAMKLCFDAHKEQMDKGGIPYVFHPIHLAEQMSDELSTVCALLHDVIEDTNYTLSDISDMGFPISVTEVLALLTYDQSISYFDYVKKLATNPIAKQIKLADLKHNSDISRLDAINDNTVQRIYKYKQAIKILMEN